MRRHRGVFYSNHAETSFSYAQKKHQLIQVYVRNAAIVTYIKIRAGYSRCLDFATYICPNFSSLWLKFVESKYRASTSSCTWQQEHTARMSVFSCIAVSYCIAVCLYRTSIVLRRIKLFKTSTCSGRRLEIIIGIKRLRTFTLIVEPLGGLNKSLFYSKRTATLFSYTLIVMHTKDTDWYQCMCMYCSLNQQ